MVKKATKDHGNVAPSAQNITGFAILEHALRITHLIIKIAITVIVPKGGHIYDLI